MFLPSCYVLARLGFYDAMFPFFLVVHSSFVVFLVCFSAYRLFSLFILRASWETGRDGRTEGKRTKSLKGLFRGSDMLFVL